MPARLGIGTASFLTGYGLASTNDQPAAALIAEALEAGVDYIDTAAAYGDAEAAIGQLASRIEGGAVRICTKIRWNTVADATIRLQESLHRLRLSAVDTVMLHSETRSVFGGPAIRDGCHAMKQAGLTRQTGISTYGTEDAVAATAQPWCDAIQVEYSVLNRNVVRALERERAVEVIVRSVLCKGLLTERRAAVAGDFFAPALAAANRLEVLAEEWEMSLPQLAIRFALDTPGIDTVVVGVANRAELQTALAAAARPALTPDQMNALGMFAQSDLAVAHPERWPTT